MAQDPVAKRDLEKKQIITVVALFAVLLLAVYFFLLRGSGAEPADLGEVPVVQATETPGPGETPDPEETKDPGGGPSDPPTNTLRDPFEPPPGAEEPTTPSTEETPAPDETPEPEVSPSPSPSP